MLVLFGVEDDLGKLARIPRSLAMASSSDSTLWTGAWPRSPRWSTNDVFQPDPASETARLLRSIADKLEAGYTQGAAVDGYGNTVGHWSLS